MVPDLAAHDRNDIAEGAVSLWVPGSGRGNQRRVGCQITPLLKAIAVETIIPPDAKDMLALLGRESIAPAGKQWTALHTLDGYLTGQSNWMVNYAQRHRAGLRVGTAITEGTANFLVNRRMAKSQQMRSSRRGADLLLQVRCAVYNGTLGSGFGQKFHPAKDTHPQAAIAA
jgi:hypothetical protein